MLAELQKDREESKADKSDNKIKELENELGGVQNTMRSFSVSGDKSAEKEDQNEDLVATSKQR